MYSERGCVRAWREMEISSGSEKGGRDFQVPTHKYNTRSRFFQDFSLWTHIPCVIGLSLSGSARFVTLLFGVILFLGLTLSLQVD